jgi:hypothetical protein
MGACLDAFPSAEEAASSLAAFGKSFVFPRSGQSAEDIALESAESSFLRPFARKIPGGSGLVASWLSAALPRISKSARYVINQGQFDILVRRTGLDLLRSWREAVPDRRSKLSYGAAFRAVDLLFMALNESSPCRSGLVQDFLHVPLEKATLSPLRQCIDELVDGDFAIEIPSSPSPGFVSTEEQYLILQEAVIALSERAGVPPIVYAYFCGIAQQTPRN